MPEIRQGYSCVPWQPIGYDLLLLFHGRVLGKITEFQPPGWATQMRKRPFVAYSGVVGLILLYLGSRSPCCMELNLPKYHFKLRESDKNKTEIFDPYRRKYVILTPEEWVRQHFLQFLVEEKKYPRALISVEKGLTVHQMNKRFDAVVYNKAGIPVVLIEFKATGVRIDQQVFEQIAAYNIKLRVSYLIVSNGQTHYCCKVDFEEKKVRFLEGIPEFTDL